MLIARHSVLLARTLTLGFVFLAAAGCTRASVAALLPTLSLGIATRRLTQGALNGESRWTRRWDALALISLQFRHRSVAAEVPVRGELAPETWIAPCDADDVICLEEAAEAEAELRAAFGELQ